MPRWRRKCSGLSQAWYRPSSNNTTSPPGEMRTAPSPWPTSIKSNSSSRAQDGIPRDARARRSSPRLSRTRMAALEDRAPGQPDDRGMQDWKMLELRSFSTRMSDLMSTPPCRDEPSVPFSKLKDRARGIDLKTSCKALEFLQETWE